MVVIDKSYKYSDICGFPAWQRRIMVIFVLNFTSMRKSLLAIFCLFISLAVHSQEWKAEWDMSARLLGGTGPYLPFWQRTGYDGLIPNSSSILVMGGGNVHKQTVSGFTFEAGANLAASVVSRNPLHAAKVYGLVDRLYLSGSWRMLHMDVGMKPREKDFGDISITGGDMMYTRNARNIPGVNMWSDWIYLNKGHHVGIKGNYAHYQFIDNRFVKNTMLHNKAVSIKISPVKAFEIEAGLEHWVQWGGCSPRFGDLPSSFSDYIRVFLSKEGGDDSPDAEKENVLGNHLGRQYYRLKYNNPAFALTFQYDIPYEDRSGLRWWGFPDGVWTLMMNRNDRRAWVTDVVYEFIHTVWQSGPLHDRPATEDELAKQDPDDYYYGRKVLGGMDCYFNNGIYRSGWTNYGRVIGLPLMIPYAPGEDGSIDNIASTRVLGHHFGVSGVLADKVPYTFKATYSRQYGDYRIKDDFFATHPWQLSFAFECDLDKALTGLPVSFSLGGYCDIGELYKDSVGLTLRVGYGGSRRIR